MYSIDSIDGQTDRFETFLLRSKSAPIHVCLPFVCSNISAATRVHSILETHTARIREFELRFASPAMTRVFTPLRGSFAYLNVLKIDVGSNEREWELSRQLGEDYELFELNDNIHRGVLTPSPRLRELYLSGLAQWKLGTPTTSSFHLRQQLQVLYWDGSWRDLNQLKDLISGGDWKQLLALTLITDETERSCQPWYFSSVTSLLECLPLNASSLEIGWILPALRS